MRATDRTGPGQRRGDQKGSVRNRRRLVVGVAVVALAACTSALVATSSAGAASSVRGFDGTTVTVAGLGIASQFGNDPIGAQARIKRFNDTNEIKGVKIKYAEFVDDKQDPATALSEARRLVTQDGVFAIVGDVSQFNPGDYFTQQQVPYFGWAFDNSYCSHKPEHEALGLRRTTGASCRATRPSSATRRRNLYTLRRARRRARSTRRSRSSERHASRARTRRARRRSTTPKAGFKVVGTNNQMPTPPVADYTPYAQAVLTADGGKAPDVIVCAPRDRLHPDVEPHQGERLPGHLHQLALLRPPGQGDERAAVSSTLFGHSTDAAPAWTR